VGHIPIRTLVSHPYRAYSSGAGTLTGVRDDSISVVGRRHIGAGANQVAQWRKQIGLPADFYGLDSVRLYTRRVGASDSFTLTLWNGATADPSINAVSVLPVGLGWELFTFTPSGTYAAGDHILAEFVSTVDDTEETQFVDLRITYKSKGGGRVQSAMQAEENLSFEGSGTITRVYDTTGRFVYTEHLSGGVNQLMDFYDHIEIPVEAQRLRDITVSTYRAGLVDLYTATLTVEGATDSGINGVSVSPSSAAAWEPFTLTPTGIYAPGQRALLKLSSQVDNTLLTRHRDIVWNLTT
jgi:hypothetical protein